jgi:protein-disulfide isomerase
MISPTDPGIFLLLRCQGAQPFFALSEQLYTNQSGWLGKLKQIPESQLTALSAMQPQQQAGALAKAIGMDQFFRQRGMPQARVDQCLADPAGIQRLAEIQNVAARDNVTGTPTFLINGTKSDTIAWPELKPKLRAAIGS